MKKEAGIVKKSFKFIGLNIMFFLAYTIIIIALLKFLPISASAFMLDYSTEEDVLSYVKESKYDYKWVNYSDINKNMALAVVASEDQNFPIHWGFDFKQIEDALKKNKTKKRIRGASTISQQLAKNMFLMSDKSYVRKAVEVYYTLLIEQIWRKERILEIYLNVAEFGKGVYGVKVASTKYFSKEPSKLNKNQSALLAAVLPRPKKFNHKSISAYFIGRKARIQNQMNLLGGVSYIEKL